MSGGTPPSDGVEESGDDQRVEGHLSIEDAAGFMAFGLAGYPTWMYLVDEDLHVQEAEDEGRALPPTPERDRLNEMRGRLYEAWWDGRLSFWGWKRSEWVEIKRSRSMSRERIEFRRDEKHQVHLYRRLSGSSQFKPPGWPWRLTDRNLMVATDDLRRLERSDPPSVLADRKPGRPSLCAPFDDEIDAALSATPTATSKGLAKLLLKTALRKTPRRNDLPVLGTLADYIRARRKAKA